MSHQSERYEKEFSLLYHQWFHATIPPLVSLSLHEQQDFITRFEQWDPYQNSRLALFVQRALEGKLSLYTRPFSPILVVGSALGGTPLALLEQKTFSHVVGIDCSPSAIKMAQFRTQLFLDNIKKPIFFIEADITASSSTDRYHYILDNHCFHGMVFEKQRSRYLKNMFELLQQGGWFFLETLCFDHRLKLSSDYFLDSDYILWKGSIPMRRCLPHERIEEEFLKIGFRIFYFSFLSQEQLFLDEQTQGTLLQIIVTKS